MINLYIVRHGETVENTKNICQGQSNGTLSKKGISDNIELAKKLQFIKFDKAYSSPLNRAKQTCLTIISEHKDLKICYDSRLMEWNMGKLQGKVFPKNLDITNNEYEMETTDAVRERCQFFLKDISKHKNNSNILIISHGLCIKMMESIISEKAYECTKLIDNSTLKELKIKSFL